MRQCTLCGRKGSRRFALMYGTSAYVCSSTRACGLRRARWVRGFTTHTRGRRTA